MKDQGSLLIRVDHTCLVVMRSRQSLLNEDETDDGTDEELVKEPENLKDETRYSKGQGAKYPRKKWDKGLTMNPRNQQDNELTKDLRKQHDKELTKDLRKQKDKEQTKDLRKQQDKELTKDLRKQQEKELTQDLGPVWHDWHASKQT